MAKRKRWQREASQIPYAQRLQIRRHAEINAERENSAQRMLCAILEALHDCYGFGFDRMNRFGEHTMELIHEFYGDRELNESRLKRRLNQIGYELHGELCCWPADRSREALIAAEGQDAAMVALLVSLVALNDSFGLGADRLARLVGRVNVILQECADPAKAQAHADVLRKIGYSITADGRVLIARDESNRPVRLKEATA